MLLAPTSCCSRFWFRRGLTPEHCIQWVSGRGRAEISRKTAQCKDFIADCYGTGAGWTPALAGSFGFSETKEKGPEQIYRSPARWYSEFVTLLWLMLRRVRYVVKWYVMIVKIWDGMLAKIKCEKVTVPSLLPTDHTDMGPWLGLGTCQWSSSRENEREIRFSLSCGEKPKCLCAGLKCLSSKIAP